MLSSVLHCFETADKKLLQAYVDGFRVFYVACSLNYPPTLLMCLTDLMEAGKADAFVSFASRKKRITLDYGFVTHRLTIDSLGLPIQILDTRRFAR